MELKWVKNTEFSNKIYNITKFREYSIEICTTKSSRNYSIQSSMEMVTNHQVMIYRNSCIIFSGNYKYDLRLTKKQAIEKLLEIIEGVL